MLVHKSGAEGVWWLQSPFAPAPRALEKTWFVSWHWVVEWIALLSAFERAQGTVAEGVPLSPRGAFAVRLGLLQLRDRAPRVQVDGPLTRNPCRRCLGPLLWMDKILHHFETWETINWFVGIYRGIIDFVHPQYQTNDVVDVSQWRESRARQFLGPVQVYDQIELVQRLTLEASA